MPELDRAKNPILSATFSLLPSRDFFFFFRKTLYGGGFLHTGGMKGKS